jgi:hypothetical protein
MKRTVVAVLVVLAFAVPAAAKDLTLPPGFGQEQFKNFSRDFGLAISYVPLAPAEPLGDKLPGFDIGVEVTGVQIDENADYWKAIEAVSGGDIPGTLPFPKVHAQVGLPFIPIDLGVVYSKVPGYDISYIGYEVKYAILKGGVVQPAIAVRGAYTEVSGLDDVDISTKYADLSISKGFAMFTPYAGYAMAWIDSKETTDVLVLEEESLTEGKAFVGCKITFFPLMNLVVEADFAKVNSYSARLNLHF